MTDRRPVLLLGAGGMLGGALARLMRERGIDSLAPPRRELDLCNLGEVERFVESRRPGAVFNASAYTDVAAAERPENRVPVFRLNRDTPELLARVCSRLRIPLIHVSTDYVFDGRRDRPYREEDSTAPLQIYGRSKLEGENAVRQAYPAALIARTSTLFGPGERQRPHYVDAILRQARTRTSLQVVRLPVSSPTYTPDLADALLRLWEVGASGIVHTVNEGACSRLELARETVRAAGLAASVRVDEIPQPPATLARPRYSVLDTGRYTSLTGRTVRPWAEALHEYVERHGS